MACNASKTAFLRIVSTRGYAGKPSPSKCSSGPPQVKTGSLPNKIFVATLESPSPICRVSVVFQAGSRNESYENMGASHMLKVCAGQTTNFSTGFAIIRNLQQKGIRLSVSSDRELVTYTINSTVDRLNFGLGYLQDMATAPAFKPWDLKDLSDTLRHQVSSVPKDVRAVELLHRAGYRTGLGNSIYCPKYHIGKLSTETMMGFFKDTCTTNRCAVVGVGVDQTALSGFAQCFEIESGPGKTSPSKWRGGGEIRKDRSSDSAHVAIAGEGGSYANMKEALAFAILQQAYGAEPSTKRGPVNGAMGKAVAEALKSQSYKFSAINTSYTDSGMFGFLISTDRNSIEGAVKAAMTVLKAGTVSEEDIKRGKALLKAIVLRQYSSDEGTLLALGRQAALLQSAQNGEAMASAIDAICDADVQAAAKKVAGCPLSMGAVGNLAKVPYLSDL